MRAKALHWLLRRTPGRQFNTHLDSSREADGFVAHQFDEASAMYSDLTYNEGDIWYGDECMVDSRFRRFANSSSAEGRVQSAKFGDSIFRPSGNARSVTVEGLNRAENDTIFGYIIVREDEE